MCRMCLTRQQQTGSTEAQHFPRSLHCDGIELIELPMLIPDILLFWRQFCILIFSFCLALLVQLILMPECQFVSQLDPAKAEGF